MPLIRVSQKGRRCLGATTARGIVLLHRCGQRGQRGNASAPAAAARGGSAAAALTNASALNATGEALDLNDAHDNATISNATATNKTDEGLRASIKAYFRGAKELWGDVKTWRRLRGERRRTELI